jgi:hypothetical protein
VSDIRWVAGFFDGEGSVGIYKNGKGYYHLRTQLVQRKTKMSVIVADKLKGRFGGNYSFQPCGNGNFKYNWQLNSQKALRFLRAVLPHSVLKRPQIVIAIQYAEGKVAGGKAAKLFKKLKKD